MRQDRKKIGKRAIGLTPALFTMLFSQSASAADLLYPDKVFTATYSLEGGSGSTMQTLSDGQGKVVTKANMTGDIYRTIFDYKNKTAVTVLDFNKMAMQKAMTREPEMARNAAALKAAGMKDLGAREIAGHACHGYQHEEKGGREIIWLDDNLDCIVQCEAATVQPPLRVRFTLKSYEKTGPTEKDLAIPEGYKLIKE